MNRFHQLVLLGVALASIAGGAFAEGGQEFTDEELDQFDVWTGERITFTKPDGADPTLEENQDRVTDSVWITRGNDGGQIFNIAQRDRYSKQESPVGTLWAVGTTDDLPDLEFAPFRPAVGSPKEVAGKDLVVFIEEEGIFVDMRFLSWSKEKGGGFSYERTTP
ncbi:MAG: hypothetical protein ACOC2D_06720 [Spirochaetota bacterium]